MRFPIYKFKWWHFIIITVFIILLLPQCASIHMSDQKINEYFKNAKQKPIFHNYTEHSRNMHFASIGADTLPMVIFIHGSPGSWDAFISFFNDSSVIDRAKIISVDRPGFGKSGYGKVEISLKEQAALLMPILKKNKSKKLPLLIGHSLGGPVVCRIAMDYPNLVGEMVLVAPSIDPSLEKYEWYRDVGNFFLFRPLLPKELDVSNREILALKKELINMLPYWQSIRIPTTVIQGEKDDLVAPQNAAFAKKMLVNAPVHIQMIPKMNHFIPWSRPDLIQHAILEYLNHK